MHPLSAQFVCYIVDVLVVPSWATQKEVINAVTD